MGNADGVGWPALWALTRLLALTWLLMLPCLAAQEFATRPYDSQLPVAQQLPDFSYAGYDFAARYPKSRKQRVFPVRRFGARANDDSDDRAAIQAAIDAAHAAGGGIVQFESGRYLMWTDPQNRQPLRVSQSHTILRGAAKGEPRTVIYQAWHGLPTSEASLSFQQTQGKNIPAIRFEPESLARTARGELAVAAQRGSTTLLLKPGHSLQQGMYVAVHVRSKAAVSAVMGGHIPPKQWTRLHERGAAVNEMHLIRSVDGNRLTLMSPLQIDISPEWPVKIMQRPALTHVGSERISWEGGWLNHRYHHRSGFDDYAWSMIQGRFLIHSWFTDQTFHNVNDGLFFDGCSNVSVLRTRFTGNAGHFSTHTRRGNNMLFALWSDETNYGFIHGPGLGYSNVGVVYWRAHMQPQQSIDSHSGAPYASLFDHNYGGRLRGNGGPLAGFPNHGPWLTVWNFRYGQAKNNEPLNFGVQQARDTFINPLLIGVYGESVPLLAPQGVSDGIAVSGRVEPQSLWLAQLKQRYRSVPRWISTLDADWSPAGAQDYQYPWFSAPQSLATPTLETLVREVTGTPVQRDDLGITVVTLAPLPKQLRYRPVECRAVLLALHFLCGAVSDRAHKIAVSVDDNDLIFDFYTPLRLDAAAVARHKQWILLASAVQAGVIRLEQQDDAIRLRLVSRE